VSPFGGGERRCVRERGRSTRAGTHHTDLMRLVSTLASIVDPLFYATSDSIDVMKYLIVRKSKNSISC